MRVERVPKFKTRVVARVAKLESRKGLGLDLPPCTEKTTDQPSDHANIHLTSNKFTFSVRDDTF